MPQGSDARLPATGDGFLPLFTRRASQDPERVFARIGGHTVTFGALDRRSAALADWLASNGVRATDRVALMLRNGETAVAMMFAIARAGAVWVPVNTQAVGDNLAYILTHAEPRTTLRYIRSTNKRVREVAKARAQNRDPRETS